jgi:hypothetical protein
MEKNIVSNHEKDEIPETKPNMEDFLSIKCKKYNNKVKQISTQKSNIENISPRHLTNAHSRKGSFVETKSGVVKTGLFANIHAKI